MTPALDAAHATIREVFGAVVRVALDAPDDGAALARGLAAAADSEALLAVAEAEAAAALVTLRARTAISLGADEWLAGPLEGLADALGEYLGAALIRRVALVAGGVWEPPAPALAAAEPAALLAGYLAATLGCVHALAALGGIPPETAAGEVEATSAFLLGRRAD